MKTNTHKLLRIGVTRSHQHGMTLIEIMVALVIGLLLLAGIGGITLNNQKTYKVQDAMARLQENGRFSLHFLSRDIRMAGFMGCGNVNNLNVSNNVDPSEFTASGEVNAAVGAYDGTNSVQGYTYTGTLDPVLAALGLTSGSAEGDLVPNTDLIFIRRGQTCDGGSVLSHNNNSAVLFVVDVDACGIQSNDIVMVSDCQTADIFGATQANGSADSITHGSNLNLSPQLANGYGPGASVYGIKSEVYFVGYGASGQPSLFKAELRSGSVEINELVEGIDNMTILYGEDRTAPYDTAEIYVTANNVAEMDNVISVRITMNALTLEDNISAEVGGEGDRRIRRSFTTTIGIRNRMS